MALSRYSYDSRTNFLPSTTFFLFFSRIDSPLTINFVARSPLRLFVSRFPWTNFFRPRENCKGNNPHCVRVTNESIRVRCDSESLKKDYRSKPEEKKKKKRRRKKERVEFLSPIDFYAVTITGGVWIMPFFFSFLYWIDTFHLMEQVRTMFFKWFVFDTFLAIKVRNKFVRLMSNDNDLKYVVKNEYSRPVKLFFDSPICLEKTRTRLSANSTAFHIFAAR